MPDHEQPRRISTASSQFKLPKDLLSTARQAAATLPCIETWPSRTEAVQAVMLTAWRHGLRSGLLVGLPSGIILALIILWGIT